MLEMVNPETLAPPQLFHMDDSDFFDMQRLRNKTREVVRNMSVIQRCKRGDLQAAIGLKLGYYAYVADFQAAIDMKANSSGLPRQPLYAKFGRDTTRKTLLASAQNVRVLAKSELDAVFSEAERELMQMQREERTHWHHWVHDAMALGLTRAQLEAAHVVPAVRRLIAAARADDLVAFFAGSLAATEFIAEEVGETLAFEPRYGALMQHGRTEEQKGKPYWMIVHTVPHVDGPSHAEIVLDFARAYCDDEGPERLHQVIERGLELFGTADTEIEAHFCRRN